MPEPDAHIRSGKWGLVCALQRASARPGAQLQAAGKFVQPGGIGRTDTEMGPIPSALEKRCCDTGSMSIKHQRPQPKHVYQLRVELLHIAPAVWRRILVPGSVKLSKLDRIVQAAMGWTNSHLHEWNIAQQRYGILDEEWFDSDDILDERKFTVGAVLDEQVQTFAYTYDFGDGWEHRITVEERQPVQAGRNDWPMCLAGENACPPEDVGGEPGYMDFVEAMRNPAHEQHADYWRWWGGPFDAKAFSINAANLAIRRLR